jgi:hypothetical protein
MLDDAERRTLDDIESRLLADDPRWVDVFAAQQRRLASTPDSEWMHHMLVAGAAFTGTLAVIVLFAGVPSLTAFFMLCTIWLIWLVHRPSPGAQRSTPQQDGRDSV